MVSYSSTESEIVALEQAIRSEARPMLTLWEHVVLLLHPKTSKSSGTKSRKYSFPIASTRGMPAQFSQFVNIKREKQTKSCVSVQELREEAQKDELTAATHTKQDLFTGFEVIDPDPYKHLSTHAQTRPKPSKVRLITMEDNEAVTKILHKGRSNALRHIHRTHRVSCDWLYEVIKHEGIFVKYVNTEFQLACIMTKAFTKADEWLRLLSLNRLHRLKLGTQSSARNLRRHRGKGAENIKLSPATRVSANRQFIP